MEHPKTVTLPSGDIGTVVKIYSSFYVVELRDKPKVKRPRGYFFERKIISFKNLN